LKIAQRLVQRRIAGRRARRRDANELVTRYGERRIQLAIELPRDRREHGDAE
jgi:hypothetical protein